MNKEGIIGYARAGSWHRANIYLGSVQVRIVTVSRCYDRLCLLSLCYWRESKTSELASIFEIIMIAEPVSFDQRLELNNIQ